ncbi:MAG TPA: hypothetical protein VI258_04820 [Rhodanobacteraceae bacterium]
MRAAPHASGPGGWEIALGVAGFLVMMTIGGAAALLVFVDRVVAGMRGIS